jgi:hypothetical protein
VHRNEWVHQYSIITRAACIGLFYFSHCNSALLYYYTIYICNSGLARTTSGHFVFEITQSKYYNIFIFWISIFIFWNIILKTLQILSCVIMIYIFNFSWVWVGGALVLVYTYYIQYTSRQWVILFEFNYKSLHTMKNDSERRRFISVNI